MGEMYILSACEPRLADNPRLRSAARIRPIRGAGCGGAGCPRIPHREVATLPSHFQATTAPIHAPQMNTQSKLHRVTLTAPPLAPTARWTSAKRGGRWSWNAPAPHTTLLREHLVLMKPRRCAVSMRGAAMPPSVGEALPPPPTTRRVCSCVPAIGPRSHPERNTSILLRDLWQTSRLS